MTASVRTLRVFSTDPSLSTRLDSVLINEIEVDVPWEVNRDTGASLLQPGPVGDYVEVIDYDPASQRFYEPLDLNRLDVISQRGLKPSVGNPQFHQQMVYAVAMTTIRHFEAALGRKMLWSDHLVRDANGNVTASQFVRRLRIYPHALREPNAYYSPRKKALLFGYFPAGSSNPQQIVPNTTVFTCLSQDIIVHETTHALLDGLHPRFTEPTGVDALAFHEAFADIVALFQHFSYPTILRHVISRTRGDLESQNQLGQLAQQFGYATGHRGALRSALGSVGPNGEWARRKPDPTLLADLTKPHSRGAILVAAVFDAFLAVYKSRIRDLISIASSGSGTLAGGLSPELTARLAGEAEDTARHMLQMCIRALDYCPPVDMTFADYLQALVTADCEVNAADPNHYRVAIMESFRAHGIAPESLKIYSEESLRWSPPKKVAKTSSAQSRIAIPVLGMNAPLDITLAPILKGPALLADEDSGSGTLFGENSSSPLMHELNSILGEIGDEKIVSDFISRNLREGSIPDPDSWLIDEDVNADRFDTWNSMRANAARLKRSWLPKLDPKFAESELSLILRPVEGKHSIWSGNDGIPKTEVHSVRVARRLGGQGEFVTEFVIELTQRRRGYLEERKQELVDAGGESIFTTDASGRRTIRDEYKPDFRFRGGCTLLVDVRTGEVRFAIRKRSVLDEDRLRAQREFLMPGDSDLGVTYFGEALRYGSDEPFAMLHK